MSEQNPYLLYPEHPMDRRPRYYDGQFLQADDFIDDQRYAIDRHRRHLAATVTPGVVAGFELTAQPDAITIGPGSAIDALGRQIVLIEAQTKAIAASARGGSFALYVQWSEIPSDEAEGGEGTAGYTRFHELPTVAYAEESAALPEHAIRLCTFDIDEDGNTSLDATARPRAGLRVPGPTPAALTTDEADPGRATLTAALRVDLPDGTAHDAETPALDVRGHARITGGLIVGQDSDSGYQGVRNNDNDLVVTGRLTAGGFAGSAIYKLGVGYPPPAQDEGTLIAQRAALGRQTLDAGYTAHVEGKAKISDAAHIGGAATIGGTLTATAATTLQSTLTVGGATTLRGNTAITGTLSATAATTLGGRLDVAGQTTLATSLTVGGATTLGGATTIGSSLTTTHRADIGGALTTGGRADIGGGLTTTGAATIGGALSTGGGLTVSAGISGGGNLSANGNLTLGGRTLALGDTVAGQADNAGKIKYNVHGTDALEVFGAGTSTSDRKIKLYAEGGTLATGPLSISGALTTSGGGATLGGGLTATSVAASANSTFARAVAIGQTGFDGYGGVTADSNDLVVNGQFAAGGSGGAAMYSLAIGTDAQSGKEGYLFVGQRAAIGRTTAGKTLDVEGTARISGATEIGGQLDVGSHLVVNGGRILAEAGTDYGITFGWDVYGGSGDYAGIRYWRDGNSGEATRLEIKNNNDNDDIIVLHQKSTDVVTIKTGRCGINYSDPAVSLHVGGRIKVDDDYALVAPGDKFRVCFGLFNSNGSAIVARGLSCTRESKGQYKISFATHYKTRPACFSQQYGSGNGKDGTLVSDMYTSYCRVYTNESDGSRDDRAFTIMAIGEVS